MLFEKFPIRNLASNSHHPLLVEPTALMAQLSLVDFRIRLWVRGGFSISFRIRNRILISCTKWWISAVYIHLEKVLFLTVQRSKSRFELRKIFTNSLQTFWGRRLNKILRIRRQETTSYSDFYICCELTLRWYRRGHWFNPSRAHHCLSETTHSRHSVGHFFFNKVCSALLG